jgi:LPXTG-motif cell wall-anchored protein
LRRPTARRRDVRLGRGRSIDQAVITGLPVGTTCRVAEATGALPPGAVVTYDPADADTAGVVIPAVGGIAVVVTNDFSAVAVQTAELRLAKVVTGSPGTPPADGFVAHVVCDDGTDALVALPGAGGDGTPVLSVRVGSLCGLEEDTSSLPSGWTAAYAVGDGPPSPGAVFQVLSSALVAVTVINDAPLVATTTTSTTTTTTPTTTTTTIAPTTATTAPSISGGPPTGGVEEAGDPGALPATGNSALPGVLAAAASLLLGFALVLVARRNGRATHPVGTGHG